MKRGLLIYTKKDAALNRWFIDQLILRAGDQGIKLAFVTYEDYVQRKDKYGDIDFCINRCRFASVNQELEAKGITCYNNEITVRIANDKWATYLLCKDKGIPVMETSISDPARPLPYPFILKSREGHGGKEVYKIDSTEDIKKIGFPGDRFIMQQQASCLGLDVRVYVMGGKILGAVKRTSTMDFRSNYSLGGKVELIRPHPQQVAIVELLQETLHASYAGFDFIMDNGQWVLNEIEDAVGARMLYSLMDIDICHQYIQLIKSQFHS